MSWYRVVCDHGPGHQSRNVWFIEAENRKEAVEKAEYDIDNTHWDWPVWKVRKVSRFKRADLERLIDKKRNHMEYLKEDIENTERQIEELKSFRGDVNGPYPEDVAYVKCPHMKPKHACMRGATNECFVSKNESGEKGWPYKKLFGGICMDCPYGEVFLKDEKINAT